MRWQNRVKHLQSYWRKQSATKRRGIFYLVLGVSLWFLFLGWRVQRSGILAFDKTAVSTVVQSTGSRPIRIRLPKFRVDLAVTEAVVTDGTWEISETGASHWNSSANPVESGNVVIYGHNKNSLFGPIRWLEIGDEVEVTTAEGDTIIYRVEETAVVSPKDINYVLPTNSERLTLYTCTGFLDRQRYIVIALPDSGDF
ncbi:hypothetical protein A3A66_00240 [Microgenomates group bacterium RIFCSPLOWO2_01_FULL_46_13]|nr:MAG: hypothetical protein A2783_03520 [Microgenomates group bacterium RIFCSPHIGHO2_01_FULL_45_11]OGV94446.1 MAG: hypothetical protein A3A66_00240 [Microgenomates group bacterium RIFCSPLOWO2_01_FULL_46_13]